MPIATHPEHLQKGGINKYIIEQELIAIHGRKFLARSDHRPLMYLFSMKNPTSKLTRIRLDLGEYDLVIEYTRGRENYTEKINFMNSRTINAKT